MKYIRTINNYGDEEIIFDTDELIKTNNKIMPYKTDDDEGIMAEDIVKQADTIEELCDLLVVWLKNRELPIIERPQKGIKLHPSYFNIGECSFNKGYGAIWTDKGLIYVAKMNEKGKLELL